METVSGGMIDLFKQKIGCFIEINVVKYSSKIVTIAIFWGRFACDRIRKEVKKE